MMLVVRTEFQALKDVGRHAAVMTLVGIADHRPERGLVARPRGLCLLDQITQGLFADHRKDDLAHGPVRFLESRAGKVEQEILLARDALQIIEQFPIHPAFGARPDAMNGLDQNIDEVIRQRQAAHMHEGREPSEPCRLRMPAEPVGARLQPAADSARAHAEARGRTNRRAVRSRESAPAWPAHLERWPGSAFPDPRATAEARQAPFP